MVNFFVLILCESFILGLLSVKTFLLHLLVEYNACLAAFKQIDLLNLALICIQITCSPKELWTFKPLHKACPPPHPPFVHLRIVENFVQLDNISDLHVAISIGFAAGRK